MPSSIKDLCINHCVDALEDASTNFVCKLVDDTEAGCYGKDEVGDKDDVEVSQPLHGPVMAHQVKVGYTCNITMVIMAHQVKVGYTCNITMVVMAHQVKVGYTCNITMVIMAHQVKVGYTCNITMVIMAHKVLSLYVCFFLLAFLF